LVTGHFGGNAVDKLRGSHSNEFGQEPVVPAVEIAGKFVWVIPREFTQLVHRRERDGKRTTVDVPWWPVSPFEIPQTLVAVNVVEMAAELRMVLSVFLKSRLVTWLPEEPGFLTNDEAIVDSVVSLVASG